MDEGFALRSTVGNCCCGCVTVTVTESEACPAELEHMMVYVVFTLGNTDCEPESDFPPDQPFEAVHESGFPVGVQASVEEFPEMMVVGFAVMSTVGGTTCASFEI